MIYSKIHGYSIPKLVLGTVALGLDYGIANAGGKPRREKSLEILSYAVQQGINCFDTARTYGSAEELIGDFLTANPAEEVAVVTKFKISASNIHDIDRARIEVMESIRRSLQLLRIERIPICLFHMDRRLPAAGVARILPVVFSELQEQQLIDIAGVSIDHPSEISLFIDNPLFRAFQIPVNIFDQRLTKLGTLEALKAAGKIVFARSIFLQGLFFLSPDQLTGNLKPAASYLRELKALADNENMSIAQFAFSYVANMDTVTSIVFGAEEVEQVKENIALLTVAGLRTDSIRSIRAFEAVPEDIITPGNWKFQADD